MTTVTKQNHTRAPRGDTRQPELAGMPKKTKSQLCAEEVAQALEELDVKKETVEHRKIELIGQLKADGLTKIKCYAASGRPYGFDLESLEKLKIRKPAKG